MRKLLAVCLLCVLSVAQVNTGTVTISGRVVTNNDTATITLNWVDGVTVDHFNVYNSSTPGGPYTVVTSVTVKTWSVTVARAPARHIYYVVTAVDSSQRESGFSNEADANIH